MSNHAAGCLFTDIASFFSDSGYNGFRQEILFHRAHFFRCFLTLLYPFLPLLPYFAALISSAASLFSLRCIYFSLVAIPPLI